MSTKPARFSLATIAALSTAAAVHAGPGPTPLYVDAAAPAGGNGSSWSQAFRDLQDALTLAKLDPNPAKQYDIRVAQGVYTPDRGTGNQAMTFLVASGMTLTGGYAGVNAANPDQRDPSQFVSVLSGDLNGDDAAGFMNTGDNSRLLLYVQLPGIETSSVREYAIRGVTISGGGTFDTGSNGGVWIDYTAKPLLIEDCIIQSNQSWQGGGGIFARSGLRIQRCVIRSNRSSYSGGGISCSTLAISNSVVEDNAAFYGEGGGLAVGDLDAVDTRIVDNLSGFVGGGLAISSQGTMTRCVIAGNTTQNGGGGISFFGSALTLTHCLVAHNSAQHGGGIGTPWYWNGRLVAKNCTVVNNTASDSGGGLYTKFATDVVNCVFAFNTAPSGPVAVAVTTPFQIRSSLIQGGVAGIAMSAGNTVNYSATNIDDDPQFVDRLGTSSSPTAWRDKDYRLRPASVCVDAADASMLTGLAGIDIEGNPWPTDILSTPNTGLGAIAYLDLGAYETQPACPADFDGSGQVAIDDLFWFLNLYFTGDVAANIDQVNGVTIDDLFFFLNAWFRGC